MHRNRFTAVLTVATLLVCLPTAAQAARVTYQLAEMVAFADGAAAPGAATLVRTRTSLTANLAMSGLDAGHAYTVWWVLWNDPAACVDGCGEDDLFISGNAIFYAGGFIASGGGTAHLTVRVEHGRTPLGMDNFTPPRGLKKGRGLKSEAHLVVRRHELPRAGSVHIQIGTFEPEEALGGACPDTECYDQFAFVFPPVE